MNIKKILAACIAVPVVAAVGWFVYPLVQPAPPPAPLFSDWSAIVVAGDWRAQNGMPSQVFDNGRREIAKKLVSIGFRPENMLQFSVQSDSLTGENVLPSTGEAITNGFVQVARKAGGGCLLYLTSHGTEKGVIIGNRLVDAPPLADLVDVACGDRPAVVIISACYSGQFMGAMKGANRIVFTAARDDRSSFGCGQQDEYTFFDACVLSQIDKVSNFSDLATRVDECVSTREKQMKVDPPSEPQFWLGPDVAYNLNWK